MGRYTWGEFASARSILGRRHAERGRATAHAHLDLPFIVILYSYYILRRYSKHCSSILSPEASSHKHWTFWLSFQPAVGTQAYNDLQVATEAPYEPETITRNMQGKVRAAQLKIWGWGWYGVGQGTAGTAQLQWGLEQTRKYRRGGAQLWQARAVRWGWSRTGLDMPTSMK